MADEEENSIDIVQLTRAFQNEKNCPDLLPFEFEVVPRVLVEIQQQEETLSEQPPQDSEDHFMLSLYQMELDRVKFVLASYLRVRLQKIEKFVHPLLEDPNIETRLSIDEINYAKRYQEIVHKCFQSSILQHLPSKLQNFAEESRRANLESFVMCRAREDVGSVVVSDDGQQIDMLRDDCYFCRYETIRHLLIDGSIELL